MRSIVAALLSLMTCAGPSGGSPEGAWQSDRDRTLAELRDVANMTDAQWRALSSPEVFGNMVHVLQGGKAVTVFDGECSAPVAYQLDAASSKIRLAGSPVAATLDGDRLYVPIARLPGNARETFSRADLAATLRRHPCLREFVSAR